MLKIFRKEKKGTEPDTEPGVTIIPGKHRDEASFMMLNNSIDLVKKRIDGITGKPMSAKKDFEIDNVADFFDDPSNESQKERGAIIITDNRYSSSLELKSLMDRKIKAYVIYTGQNFKSENERSQMISAVSATGGELFVIEPNADAASVTDTISRVIAYGMERSDGLDSDGDGIFDCVELGGMLLPTGRMIYTDPHKKDTDDDGLTDGEEMRISSGYGTVYVRKDSVNEIRAVVYKAKSDPSRADTDGDGYLDYGIKKDGDMADPHPFDSDVVIYMLRKADEFVEITDGIDTMISRNFESI